MCYLFPMIANACILLIALTGLLSASLVDALGLRLLMQGAFLAACALLLIVGMLRVRRQTPAALRDKGMALIGLALTGVVLVSDVMQGRFEADSYKFVVLFGLMFVASELSATLDFNRLVRRYWMLLAAYTVLVGLAMLLGTGEGLYVQAGDAGPARLAVTGSVTQQGILGATFALLSLTYLMQTRRWSARMAYALLLGAALLIVMLSASRQVILIAVLSLVLVFCSRPWNSRTGVVFRLKILAAACLAVLLFLGFSFAVDDTFYRRLFETSSDAYGSGRLEAMEGWIRQAWEEGQGLGFGYIGRHIDYDTGQLWPHNEFVRFYVEGGWPGAGIIVILFVYPWVSLVPVLRAREGGAVMALAIGCVSIITVQMLLDNVVHNIFRIAFYYLFLGTVAHRARLMVKESGERLQAGQSIASRKAYHSAIHASERP